MNTNYLNLQKADLYRICQIYNITNPCIQHALKKLLRCGRSHKSEERDIQDAIDTLHRWQEMRREAQSIRKFTIHYLPILTQDEKDNLENSENFVPGWWVIQEYEGHRYLSIKLDK